MNGQLQAVTRSRTGTTEESDSTLTGLRSNTSDPGTLFTVLENETARSILAAMGDTPLTASELGERCGVPNSTMYRQLGELEDAGLVRKSVRLDAGGHHASQFARVVSNISITLDGETGLGVELY